MADTGGLAALMKALNEAPALGSGLKSSGVSRSSGVARTTRTAKPGATSFSSSVLSASGAAPNSPITSMPKILRPEGKGFDPKAPRGSYVDVVI